MSVLASAAPAFKAALVAAAATLYGGTVQVCYGPVSNAELEADDVLLVLDVETEQERGPMSTARQREETLRATVTAHSYRGGGGEAQRTVTERAYALLDALATYLRETDPTVGGTVRSNAGIVSTLLVEFADEDELAMGRTSEVTAVIEARARLV
jgi:hypothetical protein